MERKGVFYKALGAAALIALCFAVYYGALGYGFVYDDNEQVLRNPWIKSFTNIYKLFTTHTFGFSEESYQPISYRPMFLFLYMFEYAAFGLVPWGWHLVNIALHSINSVLVFAVISYLLSNGGDDKGDYKVYLPAFMAAALFAVNPVNAEPVSWVACVPELAFTSLCLAAFLVMIRSVDRPGGSFTRRALSAVLPSVLFVIAMLLKETAVILPVLVLVYDLLKNKGGRVLTSVRAVRYLPFAIAMAVYAALRMNALGAQFAPREQLHSFLTPAQFALNSLVLFSAYLKALIFPVLDYPLQLLNPVYSASDIRVITAYEVIAFILAAIAVLRKKINRLAFLGAVMVALPILPTLYSPAISRFPFADRYLYFPSIGVALLLAFFLKYIFGRGLGSKAIVVAVAVVFTVTGVVYASKARERSFMWKDDLTLWSASLKGSPSNYVAMHSVGGLYLKQGRWREGIELLERALRLNLESAHPDASMVLLTKKTLSSAYLRADMPEKAAVHLAGLLDMAPEDSGSSYNLGLIYQLRGDCVAALEFYKRASLYARDPVQLRNIYEKSGDCYAGLGMPNDAADSYATALRHFPGDGVVEAKLKALGRGASGP